MIHAQVRAGSPNVVYVEEEKVIRVGYVSVANTDVDICAGQGGPNVVYVEGAIKRGGGVGEHSGPPCIMYSVLRL